MGFMEPQRISTTLILEADDAISSLDAQLVKVEECFSPVPSRLPVRRLFLCGDDIIAIKGRPGDANAYALLKHVARVDL